MTQRQFTPEVAAARNREMRNRWSRARTRADRRLEARHYFDYQSYLTEALTAIDDECGPLPGDEVSA